MPAEWKTGQSIDPLKSQLMIPALANMMHQAFPWPFKKLDMVELGCGDATSLHRLMQETKVYGLHFHHLTLVDSDTSILPAALQTIYIDHPADFAGININLTVPGNGLNFSETKDAYYGAYDIVDAQMVLHQMPSSAELTLALMRASNIMRRTEHRGPGHLFITELHSDYLDYLKVNEPDKLRVVNVQPEAPLQYHFDSGGEAPIVRRTLREVLLDALAIGFDPVQIRLPKLNPIFDLNPRFADMARKKTPFVYLLDLKRNSGREISFDDGYVRRIKPGAQAGFLEAEFEDGASIRIPKPKDIPELVPGDEMIFSQIATTKNRSFLNMWGIPQDPERSLWHRSWGTFPKEPPQPKMRKWWRPGHS